MITIYFAPPINLSNFLKDYYDGIPASQLKKKYKLTGRQYRRICEDNNLSRSKDFLNENKHFTKPFVATYITKTQNGTWNVRKTLNGKARSYGTYILKPVAEYIVEELKKVEWDKKELPCIIENMKYEEWYMNLNNQKIKSLQTSIEVEKMKKNPNWHIIKKLEKELKRVLKEVE